MSARPGGGGVSIRAEGCKGTRLFLRWSGVGGGDDEGVVGASVGEEWMDDGSKEAGSISRSGMGGDNNGLRVILRRVNRSITLDK